MLSNHRSGIEEWLELGLVIVPCGRRKVWDIEPNRGPARAADAYISSLFRLNRCYAERFGDAWVVLSAKYGFMEPGLMVPGPYDTTFTRKCSKPIDPDALCQQVTTLGLDRYERVVGLGGRAYREAVRSAFDPFGIEPVFPFAGLPIGRMLRATRQAIDTGEPGFDGRWQP